MQVEGHMDLFGRGVWGMNSPKLNCKFLPVPPRFQMTSMITFTKKNNHKIKIAARAMEDQMQ